MGTLRSFRWWRVRCSNSCRNDNTSAADISEVLEKDQLITAKVLRMSNSAFFGARSEVTSLRQAIVMLGFNAIKDIVMTVSTKSLHKSFGNDRADDVESFSRNSHKRSYYW